MMNDERGMTTGERGTLVPCFDCGFRIALSLCVLSRLRFRSFFGRPGFWISDFRFPISDFRFQIADCRLQIADCGLGNLETKKPRGRQASGFVVDSSWTPYKTPTACRWQAPEDGAKVGAIGFSWQEFPKWSPLSGNSNILACLGEGVNRVSCLEPGGWFAYDSPPRVGSHVSVSHSAKSPGRAGGFE